MKNKKILTLLLVSVILSTPSVTLASWWNPFTWGKKQNNTSKSLIVVDTATTTIKAVSKNTTATTTQVMKKITEPVLKDKTTKISTKSSCDEDCQNALLTKKLEGLRLQNEINLLKKQLEGSNKYQASATADMVQSVVFDACKNIEGVQPQVPGGMYGDNDNCLQVPINNSRSQNQVLQQVTTIDSTPQLSISLGEIIKTTDSFHIEWDTNLPSTSKIFITNGGFTRIIESMSGRSTHHIANINNLSSGMEYTYEIEVISGIEVKKVRGTISTQSVVATTLVIKKEMNNFGYDLKAYGGSCSGVRFSGKVLDQFGNPMHGQSITTTVPEEGFTYTYTFDQRDIESLKTRSVDISTYRPKTTSGIQIINFVSGNLSTSISLSIVPMILEPNQYMDLGDKIVSGSGEIYSPINHTCF